jgi:DnaJ-class molecular chaperone
MSCGEPKLCKYPKCPYEDIDDHLDAKPYCCPICHGRGNVLNGFYTQIDKEWSSTSLTPERCNSCRGTGVIWAR